MIRRLLLALFAFSLLATACFGDSDDAATPNASISADDAPSIDGDGVDECGQGQSFPDDPDFREAVCRPLMAMTDLIGTDATIDPEWGNRIGMAILNYANRADAIGELGAVLAEIQAAS